MSYALVASEAAQKAGIVEPKVPLNRRQARLTLFEGIRGPKYFFPVKQESQTPLNGMDVALITLALVESGKEAHPRWENGKRQVACHSSHVRQLAIRLTE